MRGDLSPPTHTHEKAASSAPFPLEFLYSFSISLLSLFPVFSQHKPVGEMWNLCQGLLVTAAAAAALSLSTFAHFLQTLLEGCLCLLKIWNIKIKGDFSTLLKWCVVLSSLYSSLSLDLPLKSLHPYRVMMICVKLEFLKAGSCVDERRGGSTDSRRDINPQGKGGRNIEGSMKLQDHSKTLESLISEHTL